MLILDNACCSLPERLEMFHVYSAIGLQIDITFTFISTFNPSCGKIICRLYIEWATACRPVRLISATVCAPAALLVDLPISTHIAQSHNTWNLFTIKLVKEQHKKVSYRKQIAHQHSCH